MKRIEFIAPVQAIRGNMSGNQQLLYAEHDNPAYESPRLRRNYARNYRPSFIGAKVSSSGKVYFAVKTKSAVHMTAKAVKAMALQGGTGALVGALLANKSATPYTQVNAAFLLAKVSNPRLTFRKYASDKIRNCLLAKVKLIAWSEGAVSVSFKNPWYDASMTTGAQVSQEVLVKFWDELAVSGISFTVDGKKGIATVSNGDLTTITFGDIAQNDAINVIPIERGTAPYDDYACANGGYLTLNGQYVETGDEPVSGAAYVTTTTAPEI